MKARENRKEIVFFLAGFLLGVLYIYFCGAEMGGENDFFSLQNLMQIRYMEVVREEYLLYLIKKRGSVLVILGILSMAMAGKYLLQGFLLLLGCSMGSMLSVLIMRFGAKGMLLFFGFIFPQDLLYIPALFGWVMVLSEWNASVFGNGNRYRKRAAQRYGIWKCILLLSGGIICGILLECYVNLIFVKFVLNFF